MPRAQIFCWGSGYQNLANKNDRPRRARENNCLRIRTLKTDDEIWLVSVAGPCHFIAEHGQCVLWSGGRGGGDCGQISGDVSEHVRPVWTDLASSSRNQNHFLYFSTLWLAHSIYWDSLSRVVTSQPSDELVGILIERGFNEINLWLGSENLNNNCSVPLLSRCTTCLQQNRIIFTKSRPYI